MQGDKVHGGRAEAGGWIFLRLGGANVPKSSPGTAMFAQRRTAAASPEPCAGTGIEVREEVFIWRAFVVVQAEVHTLATGDDVAAAQ